jgi:3-phosphoshikimate 1-carboxyvinyltransferase
VDLGAEVRWGSDTVVVTPGPLRGGAAVDCGLAGTLMRFLPPVAALADGAVRFDGDERARLRPMATTVAALRSLGVEVDDDGRGALPFTVHGRGAVAGGAITIDASASSQFVSGLLLAAARYEQGLVVTHSGERLPSLPHIDMTIAALAERGVPVRATQPSPGVARWAVPHAPIRARDVDIEPDLSNAAPFLAAALVAGGEVAVAGWPERTTQVGDRLREWLAAFGAEVTRRGDDLVVSGGDGVRADARLTPVDLDLGEGGELAPTLVGLAALADGPSSFTGIGHLRGHETDRLAALREELTALGARVDEHEDGLTVHPGPLAASRPWRASADHRMATTGALLGLAVPGLVVDDIGTTAKTMPEFPALWAAMLDGGD